MGSPRELPLPSIVAISCAKKAYKERVRADKIGFSNSQTQRIRNKLIEDLKAKEFLTVYEVARLLSCSVCSAYYYIDKGTIKSVNLGKMQQNY